jgi:hypothetical protein
MNRLNLSVALLFAGMISLASCSSEKKTDSSSSQHSMSVDQQEGVAGGTTVETFTATATVSATDSDKRTVTLRTEDGDEVTFTAGPKVRNFDKIHEGDKVNATVKEKIVIFVRKDDEDPSVTHAQALATAPKGARPGVLVAESYEIVASVVAIDSAKRTATLQFVGGQTRMVKVRKDVDLSKYNVGDSVVIRVTDTLKVLVECPA